MQRTDIEWAQNPDGSQGYTSNPITGCLNHTNGMCKGGNFPCFAYRLANGRLKSRYLENGDYAPIFPENAILTPPRANQPFYPRLWYPRLRELKTHKHSPRGIFICDMSDLFGIGVPTSWTANILNAISYNPNDRFYLLTKQPQNLLRFSPFPSNCWVGVSATNDQMFHDARMHLSKIEASVKYISLEPLLKWDGKDRWWFKFPRKHNIDWIIIGPQSKPPVFPKLEEVRVIVDVADLSGVKVFLKDSLRPLLPPEDTLFYRDGKLRQEMPGK